MKNLSNMFKEAQKLQSRMNEMQARLAELEMEGTAGGGLVRVVLDGKGQMRKISIDRSLMDPEEGEILEDLVVAATNDAKSKIEARIQEEMAKLTGGLPLPPGMKLPF